MVWIFLQNFDLAQLNGRYRLAKQLKARGTGQRNRPEEQARGTGQRNRPEEQARGTGQRNKTFSEAQPTQSMKQTSTEREARPIRPARKFVLPASIGLVVLLGLGTLTWRALAPAPVQSVDAASKESPSPSEQQASRSEAEPTAFLPEPTPPRETAVESAVPPDVLLPKAADQNLSPTEAASEAGIPEDTGTAALTSQMATAAVEDFYNYASRQSWDAARSILSDDLAQQFDPGFFEQFQQVSVENLRVTNQTAETVEMVGQNTYVYPDGSTQREERTYSVQMVNGWPSIVATSFEQVIKARN